MTNPDNVGGLPPLLQFAVFDEFGKGADDRVQDYGQRCFNAGRELCRAAPAGSGEVEELATRIDREVRAWESWREEDPDEYPITTVDLLTKAAALLRKLQQGADEVERLRDLMMGVAESLAMLEIQATNFGLSKKTGEAITEESARNVMLRLSRALRIQQDNISEGIHAETIGWSTACELAAGLAVIDGDAFNWIQRKATEASAASQDQDGGKA